MSTLLFLLMACPEPAPTQTQDEAAAQQPAPSQGPQATPSQPQGAEAPSQPTVEDQETHGVPVLEHRPKDADKADQILVVTGTIGDSTLAQVRLMAVREGQAEVFDLRAASEGRFFAEAPAHWGEPVYISAVEVDPAAPSQGTGAWGDAAEPIRLAGEDVHVDFSIGDHPEWSKGVLPALDQVVDAGPLNAARNAQQ